MNHPAHHRSFVFSPRWGEKKKKRKRVLIEARLDRKNSLLPFHEACHHASGAALKRKKEKKKKCRGKNFFGLSNWRIVIFLMGSSFFVVLPPRAKPANICQVFQQICRSLGAVCSSRGGRIFRARNSLFQLIILLSSPLYFSRTDGTKNGPSFLLKKLNKQWKRRERKERFKSELVLSRNLSFLLFRFFEKFFFFFFVCVYTRWEYFFLSFVKKKCLKWRMELEWW